MHRFAAAARAGRSTRPAGSNARSVKNRRQSHRPWPRRAVPSPGAAPRTLAGFAGRQSGPAAPTTGRQEQPLSAPPTHRAPCSGPATRSARRCCSRRETPGPNQPNRDCAPAGTRPRPGLFRTDHCCTGCRSGRPAGPGQWGQQLKPAKREKRGACRIVAPRYPIRGLPGLPGS